MSGVLSARVYAQCRGVALAIRSILETLSVTTTTDAMK
jgi:hypothetical protein